MTKDKALDLALEALEESVDLVREDYENAKKLYSNYPSRQARLLGLEDGLSKHEAAITAIKQARSAPVQEPHKELSEHMMQATNGRVRIDPVTGNAGIGTPPAAQRQWVNLTDEEINACDPQEECWGLHEAVRRAEAKLKEKNNG